MIERANIVTDFCVLELIVSYDSGKGSTGHVYGRTARDASTWVASDSYLVS
jgi:hypothetical protein